jgi:hypothetical protein
VQKGEKLESEGFMNERPTVPAWPGPTATALAWEIRAGGLIDDDAVCRRLGISRTSYIGALRRLHELGALSSLPIRTGQRIDRPRLRSIVIHRDSWVWRALQINVGEGDDS